jgi:hypothetical protein
MRRISKALVYGGLILILLSTAALPVQAVDFELEKIFDGYVSGFDFGDVDNDGEAEIVLTSPKEKAVVVLNETYQEKFRFTFNEAPRDVVISDFRGDGLNRLAIGTSGTNPTPDSSSCGGIAADAGGCLTGQGAEDGGYIYIGTVENESFVQEWKSGHLYIRYGPELTTADFDNNGKRELIAALSWYSRRLDVYEYDTIAQSYALIYRDNIGSDSNSVHVEDNFLLVGTACWSDYSLRQYNSSYQMIFRDPNGRTTDVSAGDLDGDGQVELVSGVTINCNPDYSIPSELRIYNDNGTGYIPTVIASGTELSPNPYIDHIWSTTGELFDEGGEELVIATFSYTPPQGAPYDHENVRIFQYEPTSGNFVQIWQKTFDQLEEDAYELKIHDFNQDGKNELFVSTTYGLYATKGEVNQSPVANAGENLSITSEQQCETVITGIASDTDDDSLEYRWMEGDTELLSWTPVGTNGEADLDLCNVTLDLGEHTLTLEVDDGQSVSSDDMILTIDNSAPHAAPTGGGTYSLGTSITVGGQVSDFDGDMLFYTWSEETTTFCNGETQSITGGGPVDLPVCDLPSLGLGSHTITLTVNDGINEPVSKSIPIEIIDTTAPTLSPEPNISILWPPNHKMVDITINTNANDDSGLPPTLSATVTSNEPQDGLGDGDAAPDWTEPVIDQNTGIITLQLRSERSGSGDGRIYTISITATDSSNNSSTANVEIIVPHNKFQ